MSDRTFMRTSTVTTVVSFVVLNLALAFGGDGRAATPVKLGSDVLKDRGFRDLAGKRVGLLTNPSGVNREGVSTVDLLWKAPSVNLVALFGAEHGVYGDIPAGKEFPNGRDPRTGLPVFSLYGPGPVREPTPKIGRAHV